MKRSIITINDDKCNGCGLCVPDCPEGALQIIDGKARLVSDLFCDGLGACIKTCPEGALIVEEREAEPYSERRVMENVARHGVNVIRAHLHHLKDHGEMNYLREAVEYLREKNIPVPEIDEPETSSQACGCPGSAARDMRDRPGSIAGAAGISARAGSELRQWPVQLKLLNPAAPYFDGAHLLLAADCTPFAYGNFHQDFLKNRIVIMFCPKLDPFIEEYIDKLAAVVSLHNIKSITVARMEVPCCGGVNAVLERAMQKAGKRIPVREAVISIRGDILHEYPLPAARVL
ncbi:MAG: 4Fe-4S ferredoxin [Spirochaetes bacterium RBG_13_51_14]|nr:MAG: 4Fe-4S ferredoxin [Spirochaetes bacterium RBG_13_51_14]